MHKCKITCVCMRMHVRMCVRMHVHTHAYACVCTRAYARAYACVCTCIRTCVSCIRTCIRTIRTCIRTRNSCVCTCIRTCVRMHTHRALSLWAQGGLFRGGVVPVDLHRIHAKFVKNDPSKPLIWAKFWLSHLWGHFSTFGAENTPKSRPFKVENNA